MSTYIATRCHALIQRLLSEDYFRDMAYAEGLNDFPEILSQTVYGSDIRGIKKANIDSFLEVYKEHFIKRLTILYKNAARGLKKFLREYLRKFEIENIIKIMRKKETNRTVKRDELFISPFSTLSYSSLLQVKTVRDLIQYLHGDPYEIKEVSIKLYEEHDSLLPLEGAFWKQFYKKLLITAEQLPDSKKLIKELIKTEIDVKNYFTAIGPTLYQEPPQLVETMLISPPLKVPIKKVKELIYTEQPKAMIQELPYKRILRLLLAQEETKAEIVASKNIKKWLKEKIRTNPISSLYVMLYQKLCEFEYRNLRSITTEKKYNVSPETILEHII